MAPILELYNSICSRFYQEPKYRRTGLLRVEKMGLVELLSWGVLVRHGGRWGDSSFPKPHNLICPRFCPDLSRVEPPVVRRVGHMESGEWG